MKHKRVYEMLKRYGFSPITALAIVVDARRHDRIAMLFIRTIRALG